MYVTLRRYAEVGARMYEMIARKFEEGLVPTLKGQPGFRSQCAIVSEEGDGASVAVLDERAQATRANERVRGWGRANLRNLLPDRPEAFAGECGIAEVSRERRGGQGQGQPPIVVVREFADPGPVEKTREIVRRHTLPVITGSPGFPGRLRLQGRAGAVAGRHWGAFRHPRGRAALAQGVLAGAP